MDALRYRMDLDATRDRIWQAWTSSEDLSAWLNARARIEPVLGGAIEIDWGEGAPATRGEVLSLFRPRHLALSWASGDEPVTEVQVDLMPTLAGTRLEVTHSGFGPDPRAQRAAEDLDRRWSAALERLRGVVGGDGPAST